MDQGPDKSSVIINLWDGYECWKCHEAMQVIDLSYRDGHGELWVEDDAIGLKLQAKYPFYKKGYTRMSGTEYYANHCPHCGALQGDWFVMNWILSQRVEGGAPVHSFEIKLTERNA